MTRLHTSLARIEAKAEREPLAVWEWCYLVIGITGLMVAPCLVALAAMLAWGFAVIL